MSNPGRFVALALVLAGALAPGITAAAQPVTAQIPGETPLRFETQGGE